MSEVEEERTYPKLSSLYGSVVVDDCLTINGRVEDSVLFLSLSICSFYEIGSMVSLKRCINARHKS